MTRIQEPSLQRDIARVAKLSRDLRDAALALRMVPIRPTFERMARVVRDLAARAKKPVTLAMFGTETEVDRAIAEQIADPLVHMLRNAVDHGIEPPAERIALGKPADGRVTLGAYHQGGAMVIEVADDGAGMSREKIVETARARGILPARVDAAELSDAAVWELVFAPGLSTAERVTEISGRGVGMDVVRRNIESLRGRIEIDTEPQGGTRFTLRLPLMLALIDGVIVRVGGARYVVPTLSIEHGFLHESTAVHRVQDAAEVVEVRGEVLPVHRLREVFGHADGETELGNGVLILAAADNRRAALFVDEVLGQQQVMVKTLGLGAEKVPGVSGGAILGDGRVALILDVAGVIDRAAAASGGERRGVDHA